MTQPVTTTKTTTPLWTTAPVASKLFGLGEKRIVALIQSGEVLGYKAEKDIDKREAWYVSTESLCAWHNGHASKFQAAVNSAVEKAKRRRSQ